MIIHHCMLLHAEDSRYPYNYFDKIIMLGTFDVVEQKKTWRK